MAYISEQYGFAFFAAPATGSSAVIKALEDAGIGEYWPAKDVIEEGRRVAPAKHSTLAQLRQAGLDERVSGLIKVVGVRNMFSWYVAKFLRNKTSRMRNVRNKKSWIYTQLPDWEREKYIAKLKHQSDMTFNEFLRDGLDKHDKIDVHEDFHASMDIYLHQEILEKDFVKFRKVFDMPDEVKITPFNVTGAIEEGKTYKDFYDEELISYVYQKNEPFFDRFPEYSFDGLDTAKIARRRYRSRFKAILRQES